MTCMSNMELLGSRRERERACMLESRNLTTQQLATCLGSHDTVGKHLDSNSARRGGRGCSQSHPHPSCADARSLLAGRVCNGAPALTLASVINEQSDGRQPCAL